jgi:hypothetical protein
MSREPVKSSNLRAVGYDATSQTLEIEFTSGVAWAYVDVPPEAHSELMAADSVGSYFARNIRGKFKAEWLSIDSPTRE